MREYWEQLFTDVGRRFEDYVTLIQLDPNYRIHYPDGSTLEVTSRINALLDNMEALQPGVSQGLLRFLARSGDLYRKGLAFVDRNMHEPSAMFSLRHLSMLLGTGALGSLRRMVGKFIADERLRDAHRPIGAAGIAPGFEEVRGGEVPGAQPRGFVDEQSVMDRQRDLPQFRRQPKIDRGEVGDVDVEDGQGLHGACVDGGDEVGERTGSGLWAAHPRTLSRGERGDSRYTG